MNSIAVTGASGFVGAALLPLLDGFDRIVALDVRDPVRRVPGLEFHRVDVASAELKPLFEGVDVVVHLAAMIDPVPDEHLMVHFNIDGTRRVLEAAAAVGARKLIRVSNAAVYGAWPNNPVPLTEDAPLRPNPGFSPAVQGAEIERIVAEWADDHPSVSVTTLRAATILGPHAQHLAARLLNGHPPIRVRGATPPYQCVHVDDVASALQLAITDDLQGVFNVAADGWLSTEEFLALAPRRYAPPLPAELAERVLRWQWNTGIGDVPPTILPYLTNPWAIANDRLRAAGWAPTSTNEEVIVSASPAPRSVPVAAIAAGAGAAALAGATAWALRRRRHHH